MTTTRNDDALAQLALCLQLCEQCAAECIDQGSKPLAKCIKLCIACADMCRVCIKCMSYGLDNSKDICSTCATMCDNCAAECEKGDGDLMQRCAQACRKCAEMCRQMAV